MSSRDTLSFFPSIGIPTDGGWQIEVHAWCYRRRPRRVVIPLVRKALGFERVRLSAHEKQTFAERARWMFADNRRGHAIAVAVAGGVIVLGRTRPNGRLRARITAKAQGSLRAAALLRSTFVVPFEAVHGMADPPERFSLARSLALQRVPLARRYQ